MPIHTLERADDNTFFGRGRQKRVAVELHRHAAVEDPTCKLNVLPSLPKPSDVNLDFLLKTLNRETTLMREMVTHRTRQRSAVELVQENILDTTLIRHRNQVAIVPKVRPVVQCLHHLTGAAGRFDF